MGQKFCVNAPSKAPLGPEGGGGVVGEYIDRCGIICTLPPLVMLVIELYDSENLASH